MTVSIAEAEAALRLTFPKHDIRLDERETQIQGSKIVMWHIIANQRDSGSGFNPIIFNVTGDGFVSRYIQQRIPAPMRLWLKTPEVER